MDSKELEQRVKKVLEEEGITDLQEMLDFFKRVMAEVTVTEKYKVPVFCFGRTPYNFETAMVIHRVCCEYLVQHDPATGAEAQQAHDFWISREEVIKESYF